MVRKQKALSIARVLASFVDGYEGRRVVRGPAADKDSGASVPYSTADRDEKIRNAKAPGGVKSFKFFTNPKTINVLEEALEEAGLETEYVEKLQERVGGEGFETRHASPEMAAKAAHAVLRSRDYASYFNPSIPPDRGVDAQYD